jgi:hypothetical protein
MVTAMSVPVSAAFGSASLSPVVLLLSVSRKRVAFAQRVLQSSPQGGLLNSSLKA